MADNSGKPSRTNFYKNKQSQRQVDDAVNTNKKLSYRRETARQLRMSM